MKLQKSMATASASSAGVSSGAASAARTSTSPAAGGQISVKQLKLSLDLGHPGNAVVLRCQGRLIFRDEARALSSIVADVLPSVSRMVVDLSGIDSVDSGGLGELVLTHMWAAAAGYTLKFANPREPVRRLFEITNLASVFAVYASVPEAIAAMPQEETSTA